jgi:two-component system, LytTR family, response regulator
MKINVVIVDDEPRAIKIIGTYVSRIPELVLAGSFVNPVSASEFVRDSKVDLIFLDISMPELDGFGFLKTLDKPPLVIFTTAHPEFALESYEYDAVDYLKKPIPYERFVKAIRKSIGIIGSRLPDKPEPDHIDLKVDGAIKTIPLEKIKYFQSLGNYIRVITDEKPLITQVTTNEIEDALPRTLFIRIHKSFIVNRSRIERVEEDEIMIGDIKLPIGKTFKKYVKDSVRL